MKRSASDTAGRMPPHVKRAAAALGVAVFWIAVWAIAAHAVGNSLLLPTPIETVQRLAELAATAPWLIAATFALGAVLLFLYDELLRRFARLYRRRKRG